MKGGQPQAGRDGFTLLELIAAVAVFSILVLLISQILVGTTNTATISEVRTDVESQARLVFATMGNDFSHMLIRTDVDDSGFYKQTGNDYFFFYSEAPGAFDANVRSSSKSPYSVVGYWIDPNVSASPPDITPYYQLLRFDKGLTWDSTSAGEISGSAPASLPATGPPIFATPAPPTLANTWPNEIPTGTLTPVVARGSSGYTTSTLNYQIVGEGVFRMEITFLLNNGNYSDSWYYNSADQYGLQDVTAIVVTIAILDSKTQKMLSSPATQLSEIAAKLVDSGLGAPNPSPTLGLVATQWQTEIASTDYATSMAAATIPVPLAIARQVKVFQHTFYLNKY